MGKLDTLLQFLREHASTKASKSTAMQPLNWLLVFLIFPCVTLGRESKYEWVVIVFVVLVCIVVAFYLWKYHDFSKQDPNLIRSEKHSLDALRLEYQYGGRIGDSDRGLIDATINHPELELVSEPEDQQRQPQPQLERPS